jgi:hypothetical protein
MVSGMPRWTKGAYYEGPMDQMLEHLAVVENEISVLTQDPVEPARPHRSMSLSAAKATRKRRVAAKLREAIRSRCAWHLGELEKAAAIGITAGRGHEPAVRSVAHPRVSAKANGHVGT